MGGTRTVGFVAAGALATALLPATGIFAATGVGVAYVLSSGAGNLAVDVVGKKLEDMMKEGLPSSIEWAHQFAGSRWYGGGGDPSIVLNRPITEVQGVQDPEEHQLEATLKDLKDNCTLIQGLLDKLHGKAGKAYFCDDVWQIAALANKLAITKAAVEKDIKVLSLFLDRLKADLDKVKTSEINEKVKALAEDICGTADSRHWDNAWTLSTFLRVSHCSSQHCYGPR